MTNYINNNVFFYLCYGELIYTVPVRIVGPPVLR